MWCERFFVVALIAVLVWMTRGLCVPEAPATITEQQKHPYNYEVYWEDPCVEAMRKAMAWMETFIPDTFLHNKDLGQWKVLETLTEEQYDEFQAAKQNWKETKLQCWRTD